MENTNFSQNLINAINPYLVPLRRYAHGAVSDLGTVPLDTGRLCVRRQERPHGGHDLRLHPHHRGFQLREVENVAQQYNIKIIIIIISIYHIQLLMSLAMSMQI